MATVSFLLRVSPRWGGFRITRFRHLTPAQLWAYGVADVRLLQTNHAAGK